MFTEIFNTSFFLILAILLLVVAGLIIYFESKAREQNHKINSMLSLVSTLAEDINSMTTHINHIVLSGGEQNKYHDLEIIQNNISDFVEQNLNKFNESNELNERDNLVLIEVSDDESEKSNNSDSDSDTEYENEDFQSVTVSNVDSIDTDTDSIDTDTDSDNDYEIDTNNVVCEPLNDIYDEIFDNENSFNNNNEKKNIKVLIVNLTNDDNNNNNNNFDLDLDESEELDELPEFTQEYTEEILSLKYDTKEDEDKGENILSLVEEKEDFKNDNILESIKSISINLGEEQNNVKDDIIDYKKLQLPKLRTIVLEKGLISNSDISKLKKHELLKLLEVE